MHLNNWARVVSRGPSACADAAGHDQITDAAGIAHVGLQVCMPTVVAQRSTPPLRDAHKRSACT